MEITSAMRSGDDDDHANDVVMPGFRFHPTEEELIEFYLRRKVEGKRFNVELIASLDLYRYDPWELPALAAMGEKEWFFYVPRDRKYRNGDRPNRVTASGYWKATGADRVIKNESSGRAIGLKKTLVFYTGKAPKGVRTSWIMNEYRLPQQGSDQHQKAEISLCRVYKRPGIEDRSTLPNSLSSKGSSSSSSIQSNKSHSLGLQAAAGSHHQNSTSSSEAEKLQDAGNQRQDRSYDPIARSASVSSSSTEIDTSLLHYSKQLAAFSAGGALFPALSSSLSAAAAEEEDCHQLYSLHPSQILQLSSPRLPPPLPLQPANAAPGALSLLSDKLWEWNSIQEGNNDYNSFK